MDNARHGRYLRGLDSAARSSIETGRFGRLFRSLRAAHHSPEGLHRLAETMLAGEAEDKPITEREPEDENPTIDAGFTYFGQFIDHDITFDPVSVLTAENDPDALQDFRTPRLDLDSLYGRGPADQPYLYERDDADKLLLGTEQHPASVTAPRPDLPRNSQDVALISDPRNDENIIVSQLQSLFLRFHNKVVDLLPAGPTRFQDAQSLVRWHNQWLVVHEFLPRIVGQEMVDSVLPAAGAPNLTLYRPKDKTFMPVEFSVAAYRYGHSMIRPSYSLSSEVLKGSDATKNRVPIFSDQADEIANLNGFRKLPAGWGIDWAFFFPGLPAPPQTHSTYNNPYNPTPEQPFLLAQPTYHIDTVLVDPLKTLPGPPATVGGTIAPTRSLAERNLQRGRALGLPSGQAVARRLGLEPIVDPAFGATPTPTGPHSARPCSPTTPSSHATRRCGSTSSKRPNDSTELASRTRSAVTTSAPSAAASSPRSSSAFCGTTTTPTSTRIASGPQTSASPKRDPSRSPRSSGSRMRELLDLRNLRCDGHRNFRRSLEKGAA